MAASTMPAETARDFRARATMGVMVTSLFLVLPFALNHLVFGRYALSAGAFVVVAILAAQVRLLRRGSDYQRVVLFVLVPLTMLFMSQVFLRQGIVGILWCYPAVVACYCMLSHARAMCANLIVLVVALPMSWHVLGPEMAARAATTLLAVSTFSSVLVWIIDSQQQRLHQQLLLDPLTGLRNRRALSSDMDESIRLSRSAGSPATLLTIDLDHFKRVNDRYGHDQGDRVLVEAACLFTARKRPEDEVYRIGGEEFLVLVRGGAAAGAASADTLRRAVELNPLLVEHEVTVSIGAATLRHDETRSMWARRSDAMMYTAKKRGRNRVHTDSHGDSHAECPGQAEQVQRESTPAGRKRSTVDDQAVRR